VRRADALDQARRDLDITLYELWVAYVSLGGCSDAFVLKAFLDGTIDGRQLASPLDPDIVEQALCEMYHDLDLPSPFHPV